MEWNVDRTKILTLTEIKTVVEDLRRRYRENQAAGTLQNLVIFHLAVSCGLRASEIAGLELGDVRTAGDAPYISVQSLKKRKKNGRKVRPRRNVPLTVGYPRALRDVERWQEYRRAAGAGKDDPFICTVREVHSFNLRGFKAAGGGFCAAGDAAARCHAREGPGGRLDGKEVWRRFKTAIAVLGPRARSIRTHDARHSFVTYALLAGFPLVEVSRWAGHENISMTNHYVHLVDDLVKRPKTISIYAAAEPEAPAV